MHHQCILEDTNIGENGSLLDTQHQIRKNLDKDLDIFDWHMLVHLDIQN